METHDEINPAGKAYQQAIRFLSYRSRSREEMTRYLMKKKTDPGIVKRVIEKLVEEKLIDDTQYAAHFLEDRARLNPKAKRVMRCELLSKGIDADTADRALAPYCDAELARDCLRLKHNRFLNLNMEQCKKKVHTYLKNRGFAYEDTNIAFQHYINQLKSYGEDG